MTSTFSMLGDQLRAARTRRRMSQLQLAQRVGRNQARISELERDLAGNRLGRDRLTLVGEICDALDLVPVLVPRHRVDQALALAGTSAAAAPVHAPSGSTYDDVFIDLDDA